MVRALLLLFLAIHLSETVRTAIGPNAGLAAALDGTAVSTTIQMGSPVAKLARRRSCGAEVCSSRLSGLCGATLAIRCCGLGLVDFVDAMCVRLSFGLQRRMA